MLLLIKYTLISAMVLMLVALGGMFSERSGIINIALEGIMVIGSLAGLMTLNLLPAGIPAIIASFAFSGITAVMSFSIIPGATAFTVIFRDASSLAADLVIPITPALLAA